MESKLGDFLIDHARNKRNNHPSSELKMTTTNINNGTSVRKASKKRPSTLKKRILADRKQRQNEETFPHGHLWSRKVESDNKRPDSIGFEKTTPTLIWRVENSTEYIYILDLNNDIQQREGTTTTWPIGSEWEGQEMNLEMWNNWKAAWEDTGGSNRIAVCSRWIVQKDNKVWIQCDSRKVADAVSKTLEYSRWIFPSLTLSETLLPNEEESYAIKIQNAIEVDELEDEDEVEELVDEWKERIALNVCNVHDSSFELFIPTSNEEAKELGINLTDILVSLPSEKSLVIATDYLVQTKIGGKALQVTRMPRTSTRRQTAVFRDLIGKKDFHRPREYEAGVNRIQDRIKILFESYGVDTLHRIYIRLNKRKRMNSVVYVEFSGKMIIDLEVLEEDSSRIELGHLIGMQVFGEKEKVVATPNVSVREYVVNEIDDELQSLTEALLSKLMEFQERARSKDPVKAKKSRRILFGFHEVRRAAKSGKLMCLLPAIDIEAGIVSTGGLDDQVQDVVSMAATQEIPIIFALSRRKLGRALGKSIKVSVAAVISVDGANTHWKSLMKKFSILAPPDP